MDVLDQISTVSTPALNFWGLGCLAKQVLSYHPRHLHQRPHHHGAHHHWPHRYQVSYYCYYFLFNQLEAYQPTDYFKAISLSWSIYISAIIFSSYLLASFALPKSQFSSDEGRTTVYRNVRKMHNNQIQKNVRISSFGLKKNKFRSIDLCWRST